MMIELAALGINANNQVKIPTFYKGQPLDLELQADIVVENEIIIELKATPRMEKSHIRQLLTYMKLMRKHYGLILNFGISYMSQYGMKAFVLSDFDEVVNSKGDFEDRVGVAFRIYCDLMGAYHATIQYNNTAGIYQRCYCISENPFPTLANNQHLGSARS